MNLKEIKDLIELVDDKGFAEFELKRRGFRLRISRFQESSQQEHSAPIIISSTIPGSSEMMSTAGQRGLIEARVSSAAGNTPSVQKDDQPAAGESDLHIIKSPIVGTFYRASSPTSEPFVGVGSRVEMETVVCIIEAMKLMNEIQAEVSGEIVQIYIGDGQPVEYGQPLFGISLIAANKIEIEK